MDENPYQQPRAGGSSAPDLRPLAAIGLFMGIWLIGSCVTLFFRWHIHNPFRDLTTLLTVPGVILAIALYAALLAGCWMKLPKFKHALFHELIFMAFLTLGGLFAPHVLTRVARAFWTVGAG